MINDEKIRANYQDIAQLCHSQIIAYSALLDAALMVLDEVKPDMAAAIRADREQISKAVLERVTALSAEVSLDLIQAKHSLSMLKRTEEDPWR